MKCLNFPAAAEKTAKFVMSVEIDGKGEPIDITAREYQEGPLARAIGASLKRAIMRCAPYEFPAGTYDIVIDRHMFAKRSLEPFK